MEIINNRYKIVREINYNTKDIPTFIALDFHNNNQPVSLSLVKPERLSEFSKDFIKKYFLQIKSMPNNLFFKNYDFSTAMIEFNQNLEKVFYYTHELPKNYMPLLDYIDTLTIENSLRIIVQMCQIQNLAIINGYIHPIYSLDDFYILDSDHTDDLKVKAHDLVSISLDGNFSNAKYQVELISDLFLSLLKGYSKSKSFFDNIQSIRHEYQNSFLTDYQNEILECILDVCAGILSSKYGSSIYDFYYLLISDINTRLQSFFELDDSDPHSYFCTQARMPDQEKIIAEVIPEITVKNKSARHHVFLVSGNLGRGKTRLLEHLNFALNFEDVDTYFFEASDNSHSFFLQLLASTMNNYPSLKQEIDLNNIYLQIKDFNTSTNYNIENKYLLIEKINRFITKVESVRPQVIIVDNFTFVDKFTLEFIFSNIERSLNNSKVYFVFAFSKDFSNYPSYFKIAYQVMRQNKTCREISLKPLSPFETATLIKDALFMRHEPMITAKEINKITSGNPYFTFELLKKLIEISELWKNKEDGHWEMQAKAYTVAHFFEVPSSIQSLAQSVFSKYFQSSMSAFKAISVFQVYLKKSFIRQIIPNISEQQVNAIFTDFLENSFISEVQDNIFRIDEKILQGSIYALLNNAEKQHFHQKALEILEKESDELLFDELLIHYDYLGRDADMLRLLLKKADCDCSSGDYHGAVINFERALLLMRTSTANQRVLISSKLAKVYSELGKLTPALQRLAEIETILEEVNDKKILLRYYITYCEILEEAYDTEAFIVNIEKVQAFLPDVKNLTHEEKLQVKKILALYDDIQADFDEEEKKFIQIFEEIKNDAAQEELLIDVYRFLGNIKAAKDDFQSAKKFYAESYKLAKTRNFTKKMLGALINTANILFFYENKTKNAEYAYLRALKLAQESGYGQTSILCLINLTLLYMEVGRLELAEHYLNRANEKLLTVVLHSKNLLVYSQILTYQLLMYQCQYIKSLTAKEAFEASITTYSNNVLVTKLSLDFQEYNANMNLLFGEYDACIKNLKLARSKTSDDERKQIIGFKIDLVEVLSGKQRTDAKICKTLSSLAQTISLINLRELLALIIKLVFIGLASGNFHLFKNFIPLVIEKAGSMFDNSLLTNIRLKIIRAKFTNEVSESFLVAALAEIREQNILALEIVIKMQLGLVYFNNRNYAHGLLTFIDVQNLIANLIQQVPHEKRLAFFNLYSFKAPFQITFNFINEGVTNINKKIFSEKVSEIGLKRLLNTRDIKHLYRNEDFLEILLCEVAYTHDWMLKYRTLSETLEHFSVDHEKNTILMINFMMQKLFASYANIIVTEQNGNQKFMFNLSSEHISYATYMSALQEGGISAVKKMLSDLNYDLLVLDVADESDVSRYALVFAIQKQVMIISHRRVKYCKRLLPFVYSLIRTQRLNKILVREKFSGASTICHFEKVLKSYIDYSSNKTIKKSLCYFKIENIEAINKFYGQKNNQYIIKSVIDAVYANLKSHDMIARYTEDEFAILFYNANKNTALRKFEMIKEKISLLEFENVHLPITITAGIACSDEDSVTLENILEKAYIAMRYSQTLGVNKTSLYYLSLENSTNISTTVSNLYTKNLRYNMDAVNYFFDFLFTATDYASKNAMLYEFTAQLLNYMEVKTARLILFNDERKTFDAENINTVILVGDPDTPQINQHYIKRVVENLNGFFVDEIQKHEIAELNFPTWHSILVYPISNGETVKGVFYLTAESGRRRFDNKDLGFMNLIALILEKEL